MNKKKKYKKGEGWDVYYTPPSKKKKKKPKVKNPKRCPDCKKYTVSKIKEKEETMQIPVADGKVLEIPTSQMLPSTDRHPIRFEVGSDSSSNVYTVSRNNKQTWECSCPGWKSRRKCKHLRKLGLEKVTSNSFTTGYKQNNNALKADDFAVKEAPSVIEEVSKTRKISFDD